LFRWCHWAPAQRASERLVVAADGRKGSEFMLKYILRTLLTGWKPVASYLKKIFFVSRRGIDPVRKNLHFAFCILHAKMQKFCILHAGISSWLLQLPVAGPEHLSCVRLIFSEALPVFSIS